MKFTPQGGIRPDQIGQNAIGSLSLEHIDGKYTIVLRPNRYAAQNERFMQRFRNLVDTCSNVTNAHIMRPEAYVDDDQGGYLVIGHTRYIPLGELLAEKPQIVADEAWVRNFIDDLFDALQHLHDRDLAAVELTPLSVLVRKSSPHSLMLMPPANSFLDIKSEVWTRETEYLSPQLFALPSDDEEASSLPSEGQGQEVDSTLDIYAAAQLIKRLFKFSSIPAEYQSFISRATDSSRSNNNFSFRIVDARKLISKQRNSARALRTALAILLGVAIIGIFIWSSREPEAPQFQFTPEVAPTLPADSTDPSSVTDHIGMLEDEVETMLLDSTYLIADSALHVSPESQAQQRQRTEMSLRAFHSRFKTLARASLSTIYTRDKLLGNEELFRREVTVAVARLQQRVVELSDHYQLDFSLAQAEAVKVIQEVTDELRTQAMSEPAATTTEER